MPNPLKAIHASYNLVSWAMDHDQVPNDIRRSLELVRTCDADLQHLIELRNDCLPLLQRRPKVLHRVHSIIESAQKGLAEVCEIVERCRPEADRGTKTRFSKRMAWVLVDANEFKRQEPIVSRHHAAVLAELNFLRQIALLAPVSEPEKVQERCGVQRDLPVFDSVALLGDMLGDLTVTRTATSYNTLYRIPITEYSPQHEYPVDNTVYYVFTSTPLIFAPTIEFSDIAYRTRI
ncbi:hypothetical protein ACHAP5_005229 [Fusarium lateritium]